MWFDEALIRVLGKGAKERLEPIGRRALGAAALYGREIRPGLDRGKTNGRFFLNARGQSLSGPFRSSMIVLQFAVTQEMIECTYGS